MIHSHWLALSLVATVAGTAPAALESPSGWPLASNDEAWKHLPRALTGGGARLPAWARATARDLPRTTAAMLDLDRLHRTKSPLGPLAPRQDAMGRRPTPTVANTPGPPPRPTCGVRASTRRRSRDLKAGPERWPERERAPWNSPAR